MNIKFLCLVVLLCVVHVGVSQAHKSESRWVEEIEGDIRAGSGSSQSDCERVVDECFSPCVGLWQEMIMRPKLKSNEVMAL